jgi:hypothetical protein
MTSVLNSSSAVTLPEVERIIEVLNVLLFAMPGRPMRVELVQLPLPEDFEENGEPMPF